jgi:hypothetical protein
MGDDGRKQHDKVVCRAVLAAITQRGDGPCKEMEQPDLIEQVRPAVDLRYRRGSTSGVLEHTLLESYPHQVWKYVWTMKALGPLEGELRGKLPSGHYELSISPGALAGVKDLNVARELVGAWIQEVAPTLALGSPQGVPEHFAQSGPPALPFRVTVRRWAQPDDQSLTVRLPLPRDLSAKRAQRLQSALASKGPKLRESKCLDVETGLVLEICDLGFGTVADITRILTEQLNGIPDQPDRVYLVRTDFDPWAVWILKDGSDVGFTVPGRGPFCLPGKLVRPLADATIDLADRRELQLWLAGVSVT